MNDLRYRSGRSTDLCQALPILEPERRCFSASVWQNLPALIDGLLSRKLARCYVVEQSSARRLRWFGLSAFVDSRAMDAALRQSLLPVREFLFRAVLEGGNPFLTPRQIAAENAAGELQLTVLLCRPDVGEFTENEGALLFRTAYDSFCFAHCGYGLRAFWQEVGDPKRASMLQDLGLVPYREVTAGDGTRHALLTFTPDRARAHPAFAMSQIFHSPPPRFGFSSVQQELLESALLDLPDKDFAARHGLTQDAVKKRWRAIYDHVDMIDPCLVRAERSGSDQRRLLLGHLRQHLEELRPYDCSHQNAAALRRSA
jgi:hypothetical protein